VGGGATAKHSQYLSIRRSSRMKDRSRDMARKTVVTRLLHAGRRKKMKTSNNSGAHDSRLLLSRLRGPDPRIRNSRGRLDTQPHHAGRPTIPLFDTTAIQRTTNNELGLSCSPLGNTKTAPHSSPSNFLPFRTTGPFRFDANRALPLPGTSMGVRPMRHLRAS
jgi:hypothetical protein